MGKLQGKVFFGSRAKMRRQHIYFRIARNDATIQQRTEEINPIILKLKTPRGEIYRTTESFWVGFLKRQSVIRQGRKYVRSNLEK